MVNTVKIGIKKAAVILLFAAFGCLLWAQNKNTDPGLTGGHSDSAHTSAESTYWQAPNSLSYQKDSASALLKKTGKIIMETLNDLADQIVGDSSKNDSNAEYLAQQMRLNYLEQTKDIHVPTIKAEELLKIYKDSNIILVDVREEVEQNVSMLPGAISPYELSQNYRDPRLLKGKTLITYCTIGYRSGLYAEVLLQKKLQVKNLEGGILAWTHVNGPLEKSEGKGKTSPTKQVHVYDKSWNFAHPGYEAKW